MMGQGDVETSAGILQRLAAALDEERRALLEHDPLRLLDSTRAKREALAALEAAAPHAEAGCLAQLREANRSNGLLLASRRRALREMIPEQGVPGYDAHGMARSWQNRQSLAVA